MGALTVQHIGFAGTAPNFATDTATVADTAEIGSGKNFLVYKNTGTQKTVTITVPTGRTPYTETNADVAYTLGATTGELWIPLHKDYDSGDGTADITVSDVTAVTVALVAPDWQGS